MSRSSCRCGWWQMRKGRELIYTFFQRPGMSDEALESTIEWIRSDLWVLKSVLEGM